jgi:hypothetical protein
MHCFIWVYFYIYLLISSWKECVSLRVLVRMYVFVHRGVGANLHMSLGIHAHTCVCRPVWSAGTEHTPVSFVLPQDLAGLVLIQLDRATVTINTPFSNSPHHHFVWPMSRKFPTVLYNHKGTGFNIIDRAISKAVASFHGAGHIPAVAIRNWKISCLNPAGCLRRSYTLPSRIIRQHINWYF